MFLPILATAISTWIGFANGHFQVPILALCLPLGLSWIAFGASSPRRAFKFGWMASTLALTGCLYWLILPVGQYGGLPWYLALPCPVLVSMFLSLYYGLFSLALYHAAKRFPSWLLCVAAGVFWAFMEYMIGWVLTGFPWLTLSSAFQPWAFAIQGASVMGAYALSGVYASIAVAFLLWRPSISARFIAVGLTLLIVVFGLARIDQSSTMVGGLRVVVVQGNVDQAQKWDKQYQNKTVDDYIALSVQQGGQGLKPDLVVWPETAMPFYFQDVSPLRLKVAEYVKANSVSLITGSPAYLLGKNVGEYFLFNRAFLLGRAGNISGYYDKEHLVPFGEYVPLKDILPLGKLVQNVGDFLSGDNEKVLKVGDVELGMLICYEAIFPELAQSQVEKGAEVIINISNDAWFGDTSAPWQHLQHAAMRAVEQGRWLVRSTNTGVSAYIDPYGRIVATTRQFESTALAHDVEPRMENTFFHRHYASIRMAVILSALALVGWIVATGFIKRES